MKFLFLSLLTLFIAVIVSLVAMEDPGYVLFAVGNWTVETTLVLAAIVLAIIFLSGYFLIRSTLKLWAVPRGLRLWKKHRREQKAIKSLTQGLIDLAEGHWKNSEKRVLKYVEDSDASLLNYLAAARAAQGQGADQRRDHYLKLAHENHPSADIAVGLTQAELQLKHNQLEQALATLRHLHQLAPKHAQVLKALAKLYQQLGDWEHLLEILPRLRKHKAVSEKRIAEFSLQGYLALMENTQTATELENVWGRIPVTLKDHHDVLLAYVHRLLSFSASDLSEPLLRNALRRQFSEPLLQLYGKIDGAEPARQLGFIESLLADHAKNAVALLCAGRLSLRSKLWGKARGYIEASVNAQASAEAYNELGNLLERLGENAAAAECYREGLKRVPGCEQTTSISMELSANPAIELSRQVDGDSKAGCQIEPKVRLAKE
ncbi:MAG: heme biosynthesis protein HemY [Ectothiorhodospiraceae bacterium]|nr:heme biosynthesis protein HemY [Ectothiorhodospiraceae bacterium]